MTFRDRNVLVQACRELYLSPEEIACLPLGEQLIIEGLFAGEDVYDPAASAVTLEQAYILLGCLRQDDLVKVKAAYRNLVKLHHPDANLSRSAQKEAGALRHAEFLRIQKAYEDILESRGLRTKD